MQKRIIQHKYNKWEKNTNEIKRRFLTLIFTLKFNDIQFYIYIFNPLLHNVVKWSDAL